MIYKKDDFIEIDFNACIKHKLYTIDFLKEAKVDFIKITILEDDFAWMVLRKIKLFFSNNLSEWFFDREILVYDNFEINIYFEKGLNCRYIKLEFDNYDIQIKQAKIYQKKIKGLLISSRNDGLGARLIPFLNALCLSKYIGFKFGYTWYDCNDIDNSLTSYDDNKLSGLSVGKEIDVFSSEFIKKHSYTNLLPVNSGILKKIPIEQLEIPDSWGGWFISQHSAKLILEEIDPNFCSIYPKLWNEIGFSKNISNIISFAKKQAKYLFNGNFIVIHVRSGDMIFENRVKNFIIFRDYFKAMPPEIAIEIINIEKCKNKNIVLASDDFTLIKHIKQHFCSLNNIFSLDEIISSLEINLNRIERLFFEIQFMSEANLIFSAHSSFARLSSLIGLGREPVFVSEYFSEEQQYNIIKKNYGIINTHNLQKAASQFFLFRLGLRLNYDTDELIQYLQQSIKNDNINPTYYICLANLFLQKKDLDSAEACLCNISLNNDFFRCLFQERLLNYTKKNYFDSGINNSYPKLYAIASKLSEYLKINLKSNGAIEIVKSELPYKIGNMVLNKNVNFIAKIWIVFIELIKSKKVTDVQDKLDLYADYHQAIKIRSDFSYRLGQILIEAHKNWYKGGYFKFYFKDLKELKREVKNKKEE